MAPSDEARLMLAAATKDWRALAGMADPDVFVDEIFGFHAQQAADKALKAPFNTGMRRFDEMGGQLDRGVAKDRIASLLRQVETGIEIC